MYLLSRLPRDRTSLGTVEIMDSTTLCWGPVCCLGKADNDGATLHGNPSRDATRPYGDHPLGEYHITGLSPTSSDSIQLHQYGPAGKLVLDPTQGQALIAKSNGRYGLLIHGGAQEGPYQGFRPTYGCLRLRDTDMQELVRLYRLHHFTLYIALERGNSWN